MAKKTEFSREELVTRILQKHRVIGEGQDATDGQRAIVENIIDPVFGELRQREIVDLDPDQPMAIKWKEWVATFCKMSCAEDFYRPVDAAENFLAETKLRFINAEPTTFEVVEVDPLHQPSDWYAHRGNNWAGYYRR